MNGRNFCEGGPKIGGRSGILAGFLVLLAVCSGEGNAQSPVLPVPTLSDNPSTASVQATQPPPGVPALTPAAQAPAEVQRTTAAEAPARGPHEGIQVHGHWIIVVKNPDGTVATRREFDNSLTTNALNTGDAFLTSLLAPRGGFTASSSTGSSTSIQFAGSTFPQLQSALAASQAAGQNLLTNLTLSVYFLTIALNAPPVADSSTSPPTVCTSSSGCTLATSQSLPIPNQVQLSASYTSTSTFTISEVDTMLNSLFFQPGTQGGQIVALTYVQPQYSFTSRTLAPTGSCGGSSQPPCEVPVTPGQVVTVMVTLSFA